MLPGQFIILRVNEEGERIPAYERGYDRDKGIVTIIFQDRRKTTKLLIRAEAGRAYSGILSARWAPRASRRLEKGGGHSEADSGGAIAYPQAKALFENGADVTIIAGIPQQGPNCHYWRRKCALSATRLFMYERRREPRVKRGL